MSRQATPRPSTSKAPALEPDVHMLNIGTQCADPLCRLVDFLPFKCPHCESSFCQEHYKVDAHKCPEYDETKHNRVAPDCPFCHIPVAVRPGQDPNERLELHFERECSVLTGKTQAKNTPHCAKGTCRKVLFSPIKCDTCRQQFCPAHRFPSDHTCRAPQSRLLGSTQSQVSEAMRLPSFSGASDAAKNLNAKASVAVANVSASTPGKPAGNNVFRQTDRRAKAERESRLKGMRVRNQKGLLSAEEKDQKQDKDCVIM
ncbi:hypothetical protein DFP72DRAFT_891131 [Ephemerocybe angulata]|uniref:AN1-type domain-containing protein n=1 Tax=Ephemerocybe angulata TaxID=980116 RepID=A0A8H6M9V8_9AGAR|nr:hypothetical protein DFP72DRAFT_891131 [Tulosesus angulatus]